jgi:short-subunit dehydrogenase
VAGIGKGDVVVITGASRGIGRALAVAAAGRGARLGLLARSRDDLEALRDELGGGPEVATADVADGAAVRAALADLEARLGRIDVLIANAGIGQYGPFVDVPPEEMERVVQVNVLGVMHALQAVIPGMIARRRGHLVVVSSIAGHIGVPFEAVYSASKFAVTGLVEALEVELGPYDIGVSMVNPGPVDTEFFRARGHEYAKDRPRKVPASDVVEAVLAVVDRDELERHVPRSLGAAVVVRHLVPGLLRWGTNRSFRRELADDVAKRPPG